MAIIDAQVHAYERDHPGRPWSGFLHGPAEVTGDQMVAAMDAVGVDGALLVSPWLLYRFDASYAVAVQAAHPGRFGVIRPFDPRADDIEAQIADWSATPGVVGARIMLVRGLGDDGEHPGLDRLLDAASDHDLTVNVLAWGNLELFGDLAARHPNTRMVLDHVGLTQPFEPPAPAEPFRDLPKVLALATLDNVAVKVTGACTLSQQDYPYDDIWAPLEQLFDAFGFDRCLWGTDWTRAVGFLTFEQGVEPFRLTDRLSDDERAMLMGGALERIYGWKPGI
jgi:L-fuconolactonase